MASQDWFDLCRGRIVASGIGKNQALRLRASTRCGVDIFSPEVRARAVRMVLDHANEYPSRWGCSNIDAVKIGDIRLHHRAERFDPC
ncbi:hypothetical protein ACH79_15795 [Bradyrhizobium sp. CCBAU 051011]|nr:hypothetical protein ACH79_15795 [Bradyrhizobium sp. CCBAU 051011]